MIKPYFETDNGRLYNGCCLDTLKQMPDESVDCVVTSPPYWGLRDYGTAEWKGGNLECNHLNGTLQSNKTTLHLGTSQNDKRNNTGMPFKTICGKCGAIRVDKQIGLEPTIQEYISVMTEIFSEVKRILKYDGTLWLNMGDSYYSDFGGGSESCTTGNKEALYQMGRKGKPKHNNFKKKDLIGIPWQIAMALQESKYQCQYCGKIKGFNKWAKWDNGLFQICSTCGARCKKQPKKVSEGWYLRSDIIWHKPNPMPESVTDRPTKSHEYIFLMSKSSQYFYDAEAIKEKGSGCKAAGNKTTFNAGRMGRGYSVNSENSVPDKVNKRDVWTIPTKPYSEAHFATYPVNLIFPCIKAGCRPGGIVLDPFMGSGTTAIVAERLNRKWAGIEINQEYCNIAVDRIKKETAQYKLELT